MLYPLQHHLFVLSSHNVNNHFQNRWIEIKYPELHLDCLDQLPHEQLALHPSSPSATQLMSASS